MKRKEEETTCKASKGKLHFSLVRNVNFFAHRLKISIFHPNQPLFSDFSILLDAVDNYLMLEHTDIF